MTERTPWERFRAWSGWFWADPAGFIDALPWPWRAIGLAELAAATWATSPFHAALRPSWRLAAVERTLTLVVAFDAEDGFLAATQARPGAPGLLRLRILPVRLEAHAYDAVEAGPVRLGRWNGWTAYRTARRAGAGKAAALQAAWPPAGPRYLQGGARPFAPPGPEVYRDWIARNEPALAMTGTAEGPMFVVAVPSGDEGAAASVAAQTWPRWRAQTGAAPPVAGEIALSLGPGDRLAAAALALLAGAFADPGVAAVYVDEDRVDGDGRRSDPVFKTAFDGERLRTQDFIGGAVARRIGVAGGAIRHLPRVLWHRGSGRTWPAAPAPSVPPGPSPRVLAVVPTRDRADLLRGCAAGLLERTDYPGLEVCFVDNGSVEPEAVRLLQALSERPGVRVLRIDGPFDYPALNNAAAAASDAEVLAFLNDDTLVIDPDWLAQMVAPAVRTEVGAVGAKLFYPDGRVQHAGVTLGLGALGVAGHGFRGAPGDFDGPQRMLKVARQVSAVTGACLVVGREKFTAIGGFDEGLQVAFNDVDLCLRLGQRGWNTVWTPHARMVHLESASRGRDASPGRTARLQAEAARMHARWGPLLANDPYYHPALSLTGERFALGRDQRSVEAR